MHYRREPSYEEFKSCGVDFCNGTIDDTRCCLGHYFNKVASIPQLWKSLSEVARKAASNSNPLKILISMTREIYFPEPVRSTYYALLFFCILRIIVIIICLSILVLPHFSSNRKRKSRVNWIMRKIYLVNERGGQAKQAPLILLNAGVMIVFWQLLESLLSLVYIFLVFFSLKNHNFELRRPLRPWSCAISWCQFNCCWAMTWTSLCLRAQQRNRAFISPFYFNTFFSFIQVGITIVTAAFIWMLSDGGNQLMTRGSEVFEQIQNSSLDWEKYNAEFSITSISYDTKALNEKLVKGYVALLRRSFLFAQAMNDLLYRIRIDDFFWAGVMILTCILYTFAVLGLLRSIADEISCKKSKVTIGLVRVRPGEDIDQVHWPNRVDADGNSQTSLRRGFNYLALHSFAVILSIICVFVVEILLGVKAEEWLWGGPNHWPAGNWLILVSGTFSAIASCFQCWRLYVDFDIILPYGRSTSVSGASTPDSTQSTISLTSTEPVKTRKSIEKVECGTLSSNFLSPKSLFFKKVAPK